MVFAATLFADSHDALGDGTAKSEVWLRAKDVMTTAVLTVGPRADIPGVARLLLEHRISAVPVVDENGRVQGIISEGDLARRAECEDGRSWWLSLLVDKTKAYRRAHGTRAEDVMTRDVVSRIIGLLELLVGQTYCGG